MDTKFYIALIDEFYKYNSYIGRINPKHIFIVNSVRKVVDDILISLNYDLYKILNLRIRTMEDLNSVSNLVYKLIEKNIVKSKSGSESIDIKMMYQNLFINEKTEEQDVIKEIDKLIKKIAIKDKKSIDSFMLSEKEKANAQLKMEKDLDNFKKRYPKLSEKVSIEKKEQEKLNNNKQKNNKQKNNNTRNNGNKKRSQRKSQRRNHNGNN